MGTGNCKQRSNYFVICCEQEMTCTKALCLRNPAEAVGLSGRKKKILSTPYFGREVKPFVPYRIFAEYKRTRKCVRGSRSFRSKLPAISRPSSSCFHYEGLWWRNLAVQVGTTKDQGLYNNPSAAVHPGALAAGTLLHNVT